MKSIRLPPTILLGLFLIACSVTLPFTYAPSNLTIGSGSVSVERFIYTPTRKGHLEPNQLETNPSAIGYAYLSNDIESLFTDAVRKELRFSGYKLTEGVPILIGGTIDRFYHDWVGYTTISVDMVVTFKVREDGRVIFSQTITSHKNAPKATGYDIEAMKSVVSDCIQQFLQEVRGKGIL